MTQNSSGFTLIEILIIIFIMGVLAIGASQMNFNTISNKQKAESFANKTKSTIETVKNNALVGKGIGAELFVPEKWKIDFDKTANSINVSYFSGSWIKYNLYSFNFENDKYKIKDIECSDLSNNTGAINGNIGSIIIEGADLSLSGCTNNTYKTLRITTSYKQFENIFELNTISGVIKDLDN